MAKQLFEIQTDKIEDGTRLMYQNTALTSWRGDLSNLTNGYSMFYVCTALHTFVGDLPSMTNGYAMFYQCSALTTFDIDLPSMTNGMYMFQNCTNLSSFYTDLSSLTDGGHMFYYCTSLHTFTSDLPSLTSGQFMFYQCSALYHFNGDLRSLTEGHGMFYGCNLYSSSVKNIALKISKNVLDSPKYGFPRFDIGVSTNFTNDERVKKDLGLIKHKGWDVYTNDSNATSTYTLPKYKGYTTVAGINEVDYNYLSNDIVNGDWEEHLPDLAYGGNGNWNEGMFYNCSALETFIADLSSLTDSRSMFYNCTALATFYSMLPSLTSGYEMFSGCTNLTTFYSDTEYSPVNLSSLTDGSYMFHKCTKLTTFYSDLPSLTNGSYMFNQCTNLTSFFSGFASSLPPVNLSSLTNGSNMFNGCSQLTTFYSDLPSLTDGSYMFYNCSKLTSFSSDSSGTPVNLSNLTNGGSMFSYCTNLESFSGDLSRLEDGYRMFDNCTNLGSFNNSGSFLGFEHGRFMFMGTKYLYNVIADLASVENGNELFINAGGRNFTDNKYNLGNRGLTDDGDSNGESAAYFQIGSLESLKTGYMMFADSGTYTYDIYNSNNSPIPYLHSPFALCIENRPSVSNYNIPIENVTRWSLEGSNGGYAAADGGVTCMFDGRLIVGSKTFDYINEIMFYNSSSSQQYFGLIYFDSSIIAQKLKDNFTFYTELALDSTIQGLASGCSYERYYKQNAVGAFMWLDVLYRD